MPRKANHKVIDLLYPRISSLPEPVRSRSHLQPSEMTEDERFDLLTDIFAEAYLRIRMEDIQKELVTSSEIRKS